MPTHQQVRDFKSWEDRNDIHIEFLCPEAMRARGV